MTESPWETEPDSLDFEAEGLPCVMHRNPRWRTWCGYVGVDDKHPLYGLPTNHPLKLPPSWFEGRKLDQGLGPMDLFIHMLSGAKSMDDATPICLAFHVHGGLNFAEDTTPEREPDGHWWFGFDCGHAGDYIPGGEMLDKIMKRQMIDSMPDEARNTMRRIVFGEAAIYRDQQYVVGECQSLAAQLNAVVGVLAREKVSGSPDHRGD